MKKNKRTKKLAIILIQLFWYVISAIITYYIIKTWFAGVNQSLKLILGGLVYIAVISLILIITNIIKSLKDPDVLAASDLRIPIYRYRKYKEWYYEHQRLMKKYGIDSKEANDYFVSFFKKIKYPNEWRKYQQSQFRSIRDILNDQ